MGKVNIIRSCVWITYSFGDPYGPGVLTANGGGQGRGQDGGSTVDLVDAAAVVQVVDHHQVDLEEVPTKEEWVVLQHLVTMVVLVRLDLITEVEAAAALDKQVVLVQTNQVMDLVDMIPNATSIQKSSRN